MEGGAWKIVDYKTDNVPLESLHTRGESYRAQMEVYALLASRYFGQKQVEVTTLFLRYLDRPITYCFDENDLSCIEAGVRSTINNIRNSRFERAVILCESCPYQVRGRCIMAQAAIP